MKKTEERLGAFAEKDARGDRKVFAEFYERYLPRVFWYVCYRVGDTQLAEDLTSMVFEKALTGFSSYRSEKASISTWLFAIAHNTVIDHYRKSGGRQFVALEEATEMQSKEATPEDKVIMKEERQRLQLCLAQLSPQEQDIISLKFGAELNNRQIAGMLKLSETNVGTLLYRAVRKLRDVFKE